MSKASLNQFQDVLTVKSIIIVAIHAFIGWALCGSIIGIGRQLWTMETTLIVHALGAPVVFLVVSLVYFTYFNYTSPLQTAIIFVAATILLDFFIVALLIERSFDMFGSVIGTWIPWATMFVTTFIVGKYIENRKSRQAG